jgi:hypothetical protein
MVLEYLDYKPLPNESELATEMHTDINHVTYWQYVYIPFKNRGYSEYINESLSQNFNEALSCLKGNLTRNFPIIVDTWYDESAKFNGIVTHARVITGYNSTGIFFNDPLTGPNEFLNNSEFSKLWKTSLNYWAFIVKSEPEFNLTVNIRDVFGTPIHGVSILLKEADLTKITDSNGTVQFLNLPIANYTVSYDWRLQSGTRNIALTYSKTISLQPFFSDFEILLVLIFASVLILMVVLFTWRRR